MRIRKLTLAVLSSALLWTLAAVAAAPQHQHEHAQKVGKRGEITITQPTKVGDRVLQPDTYVAQHRTSGSDHYVRFVELKQVESWNVEQGPYTYTERDNAGEIKCRVEPSTAQVKETTVYTVTENGVPRITKVAIKGEDVVHIL